jgi:hypothetical protein
MSTQPGRMAFTTLAFSVFAAASGARADSLSATSDLAPPPLFPASVCTASRTLGGPTSCKPQAIWDELAKDDCAARGYPEVGSMVHVNACWKGFRAVDYTCCN